MLKRIEQVDVHEPDLTPVFPVRIVDCGELTDRKHQDSVTTENGMFCQLIEIFRQMSVI